ncbi:MAG: hypothetical protein ACM33B_06100 [Pseudomonadota bacterium]
MDDTHEFGSGLRAYIGLGHDEEPPEHGEPSDAVGGEAPAIEEDPRERELADRLSYLVVAEDALEERERLVADRERELEARESELAEHVLQAGVDVRQFLRRRAEQQADGIWRRFDEALHATLADGSPDHAVRLAAARALLAESYDAQGGVQELEDELARLRARRTAAGGP